MKRAIIALAAILTAVATYAQATIQLQNFDDPAGVKRTDGKNAADGVAISVQAYLVNADSSLTALTPATSFLTGAANAGVEGYIDPVVITIPGVAASSPVNLQVKAWQTSAGSYAAASGGLNLWFGQSATFNNKTGGDVAPPEDTIFRLDGPLKFNVPEPTTLALGALGAAALLFRRRK